MSITKSPATSSIKDDVTGEKAEIGTKQSGTKGLHVIAEVANVNLQTGSTYPNIPAENVIYFVDPMLNGGNGSQDIDGDPTSQDFEYGPSAGVKRYVESISFYIEDGGSQDPGDYGSISGSLDNGTQIIIEKNSVEYQITNMQTNRDIAATFQTDRFTGDSIGLLDTEGAFFGTLSFNIPILLDGDLGDKLIIRVRDDLTDLTDQRTWIKSWQTL